jgi:hypothetical protein
MKPGGSGTGPAGMNAIALPGGSGTGPAGMKPGGSGTGPAGINAIALPGGSGTGPAGMKPGGSGTGPAGINAIALPGGSGTGPAGIAFAVQVEAKINASRTTFMIFNVRELMKNTLPAETDRPKMTQSKITPNYALNLPERCYLDFFST